MTQPATDFDAETVATVTLAGKDWPIPELTWRELKRCRAELVELTGRINAVTRAAAADPDETEFGRQVRHMQLMSDLLRDLSNDDYDRLVMGPLHAGLCALHPALKREELESWPSTESERQLAWIVVRRQSGLFTFTPVPQAAAEEGNASGEAEGAA